MSSNNPNLQNIPIRDESGREIRKAFIPDEGKIYFSADYSQIELRLMAHLSNDKGMIEDFISGQDIHSATAAKIFRVKSSEVTPGDEVESKNSKFWNYIRDISIWTFAETQYHRTEAKELIDGYFSSYPGVKEFMDKSIEKGGKMVMLLRCLEEGDT